MDPCSEMSIGSTESFIFLMSVPSKSLCVCLGSLELNFELLNGVHLAALKTCSLDQKSSGVLGLQQF